jgi:hypothetical protein
MSGPVDTPTATIWIEDGILRVEIKPGAKVEARDAEAHVQLTAELVDERKAPLLADISRVLSTSREARSTYAGPRADEVLSALALLVDSPISMVIGNFYLRLSRPPFPCRVFSDKEKALDWLRDFV